MEKYIMALDQGTTSSRCIIFDKNSQIASLAQKEFASYYPRDGWVEQNAEQMLESQLGAAKEAMEKIGASYADIAAIGIANQRETTIVWDKKNGRPIYNAIVWQCRRTAKLCEELSVEGWSEPIRKKCGLVIDPYFSATKLAWILDNVPDARGRAEAGELLFGTVESWLLWNLTGGRLHITDYSNASRTMLYDISELCWDKEILSRLDIPEAMLPEVRASGEVYGETEPAFFGGPIKLAGLAGDQQAALFGQLCHEPGAAKNTYGTGCFMLANVGETPVFPKNGLLATIAWGMGKKIEYALEGSVFTAGAAVQWLRDGLGLIDSAPESEQLARLIPDTGGAYFVPAFNGLGTPYWDAYARGTIVGLTRATNKNHIVRAVLESIAYQSYDVLEAICAESGTRPKMLKVDGGACANDFLMQFQADIAQLPIVRPACIETTALGAAYLAGLAVGYWNEKGEIAAGLKEAKIFVPQMDAGHRDELVADWHRAAERSLGWANT